MMVGAIETAAKLVPQTEHYSSLQITFTNGAWRTWDVVSDDGSEPVQPWRSFLRWFHGRPQFGWYAMHSQQGYYCFKRADIRSYEITRGQRNRTPRPRAAVAENAVIEAGQEAVKALAKLRKRIVAYRCRVDGEDDPRTHHARTSPIDEVVGDVLLDIHNMDVLASSASNDATRAIERADAAEEALAEAKRPFTAQMEMQNKRIVGLNGQIEQLERRLKMAKEALRHIALEDATREWAGQYAREALRAIEKDDG